MLRGEIEWLVEGPASRIDQIALALTGVSERLAPGLLLLSFGNAVGHFQAPGLGEIEVVSGKADETEFDRLLAELMEVASALPFAAGAAAALPFDRSVVTRKDVLYHAFVYLRWVLSDRAPREERLLEPLRLVLRDPHRRFERTRERVPLELAHHVDPNTLLALVTGRQILTPATPALTARLPLAQKLRGYVPLSVDQVRVSSTLDTAENRFVKAFLQSLAGVIEGMEEAIRRRGQPDAFSQRLQSDCTSMRRTLRPIMDAPLWGEVGRMVHLPAASTVLQRRRGYRHVFRHFARMRLAARVPLASDLVWDLLEARDIAELYELWSFFMVARVMKTLLGPPTSAGGPEQHAWGLQLRWGLSVCWPDGTRLLYNPRFAKSTDGGFVSYSVPFRPDIALEVKGGPNQGLHLLDAKFRIDQIKDILADDGNDEAAIAAGERRGTFKQADLYKMHAYRDAIPSACSVWIVYPGSETRFFPVDGATVHKASDLPATLDGVGAVPLALGGESRLEAVSDLLSKLCGLHVSAADQMSVGTS